MAMTNAERQRRWRERHPPARKPDRGLSRRGLEDLIEELNAFCADFSPDEFNEYLEDVISDSD